MTKDEAMKMALEALLINCGGNTEGIGKEAIAAIKDALAQPERLAELGWQEIDCPICGGGARAFPKPEQEPVRYEFQVRDGTWHPFLDKAHYENTVESGQWPIRALYTTPPAQRKPLTEDEEFSNGFALALHDAVLIRFGADDEPTRQAIARIDKLVNKYKDEAAHDIKE